MEGRLILKQGESMEQSVIDFEAARAERDAGMLQAINHAEDVDQEWPDVAYAFLCRYAAAHEHFEGWQVTQEAQRLGYGSPTTDRAWGSLYVKAQKEGVIAESGSGRNPYRHNSICIRYRSLLFVGVPA